MTQPLIPPDTHTTGCDECDDMGMEYCDRCEECLEHADYCSCCSYCGSSSCGECDDCGRNACRSHRSDCEENRPQGIHSYGHKPTPQFYGKGPLFLGMELEVECRDSGSRRNIHRAVEAARDLEPLVYLKEDSSLSHGFEMVTHPMGYDYAMGVQWDDTLQAMEDAGAYTGTETGIHVHVSRGGFSAPSHVYNWMKLFYLNASTLKAFAMRDSHWGEFTRHGRRAVKDIAKGQQGSVYLPRYSAINCQNHSTFEIRIFRSSLDPAHVRGILSLVDSTVEYARTLTAHDVINGDGWAWNSYLDFLSRTPRYSPALARLEALACAC